MTTQLTFAIAGLTVHVTANNPDLLASLAPRVVGFPAVGAPRLQANLTLLPTAPDPAAPLLLQATPSFQSGSLYIDMPPYKGHIDVTQGEAALAFTSPRPAEDVEYFLRLIYALLLFQAGGVLFHAAGLVRNGRAFALFGHSGSGKSTATRVSVEQAQVLNDDLIAVRPGEAGWLAFSTPFGMPEVTARASRPQREASAPLAMLLRLVQAPHISLEPMPLPEALAEIIANVPVIPQDPQRLRLLLERAQRLINTLPTYRLHFLPDASFWGIVMPLVSQPDEF